jgi:hypothetical protein
MEITYVNQKEFTYRKNEQFCNTRAQVDKRREKHNHTANLNKIGNKNFL